MTTKNILDLTDPTAARDLPLLINKGEPFIVRVLGAEGFVVNTYTATLSQQKDRPNSWRWHAYKKTKDGQHRLYIGVSEDITIELLRTMAQLIHLTQRAKKPQ